MHKYKINIKITGTHTYTHTDACTSCRVFTHTRVHIKVVLRRNTNITKTPWTGLGSHRDHWNSIVE